MTTAVFCHISWVLVELLIPSCAKTDPADTAKRTTASAAANITLVLFICIPLKVSGRMTIVATLFHDEEHPGGDQRGLLKLTEGDRHVLDLLLRFIAPRCSPSE